MATDPMMHINSEWSGLDGLDASSIPDKCVHELFMDMVELYPDVPACWFEDDKSTTLTYKQLDIASNRIANYVRNLGAKPDDLIGVCLMRNTTLLASMLGIMKSGAAYVALDPKFPPERLAYVIEEAGIKQVVTEKALIPFIDEVLNLMSTRETEVNNHESLQGQWVEEVRTTTIKHRRYALEKIEAHQFIDPERVVKDAMVGTSEWGRDLLHEFDEEYHKSEVASRHLAYGIYTSGSTGKPKGVLLPHRGVVNFLLAMQDKPGCKPHQKLLAMTTICFDISVMELFMPLITGGTVIICSAKTQRDGIALKTLIANTKPDIIQATPATWSILIESAWVGDPELTILCGGEPLPVSLANNLTPRVKELWNMYGPTEVTVWCTAKRIEGKLSSPPTIGRPIQNTTAYILDMDTLQPVAPGKQGKLFLGGEQNARGYNKRPEITAEKFIPDPFRTDVENPIMYDSGDLARFNDDGEIICCGRADYQVKINGFRIELGEIESALDRHPSLKANVVAVSEIAGNKQLVAYVVAAKDVNALDIPMLKNHIETCCTPYMVPSIFIQLEGLPLLPNGKVNRNALPKPEAARAEMADQTLQEPRNPHEKAILDMCQQHLGIQGISTNTNLFSIGGDSLFAVKLHNSIEAKFDANVTVADILSMQTIIEIAAEVKSRCESEGPCKSKEHTYIVPFSTTGSKPPLILFHPAGGFVFPYFELTKHFSSDQPIYGVQGSVKESKSITSIETMSQLYADKLIEAVPVGPYTLAGWSMGGFLALETAARLAKMGHEVALVVLIDQPPKEHAYSRGYFLFESITKGKHMLKQQVAIKNEKLKDSGSTFVKGFYRVLAKMAGAATEQAHMPSESVNKGVLIDPSAGETLAVLDAHMKMTTSYTPRNYNGVVMVVRAIENEDNYNYMTDWSLHCPKAVYHDNPGTHFTCLKGDNGAKMASLLSVALEVATYKLTNIPREGGDDPIVLGYGEFDSYTKSQKLYVPGRHRSSSVKTVGRLKLFAPSATEVGQLDARSSAVSLLEDVANPYPKPEISFESFVLLWKKTEDGEENILVENKKSELKEMKSFMRGRSS